MKTVVIVLCMAGVALAQQRRQQEPPATDRAALGKLKSKEAVDVSVKTGTEIIYDDNFLDLNDKQIKQLENNLGNPDKFKIDKPEDFIYSVWVEIKVRGRLLGDNAQAGLKVQPYFYQSNSIANYEEYELFVRQDIGRHEAGLEYQLDRDVYLREIDHIVTLPGNITTSVYDSARYTEHEVAPYYRHAIHSLVSIRGSAGYRFKDFESPFEYRDLSGFFVAVGPIVDLGRGVSAFFQYEFTDMQSEASSTDPDLSHRQHEFQVGGAVELLQVLELSVKYRVGLRDYTTSNTPANDPSHADRDDVRHKIGFRARWKIAKSWTVRLEYTYWHDDSHRPFADESVTSEPGNSTRNAISIGATFAF